MPLGGLVERWGVDSAASLPLEMWPFSCWFVISRVYITHHTVYCKASDKQCKFTFSPDTTSFTIFLFCRLVFFFFLEIKEMGFVFLHSQWCEGSATVPPQQAGPVIASEREHPADKKETNQAWSEVACLTGFHSVTQPTRGSNNHIHACRPADGDEEVHWLVVRWHADRRFVINTLVWACHNCSQARIHMKISPPVSAH